MRKLIISGIIAVAAAITIIPSAASASESWPIPGGGSYIGQTWYEVDNGTSWALVTPNGFSRVTLGGADKGYADAGVVVSLGPASQFNGITADGSANLADNIWIVDGSQATTPGVHLLSAGVNFDYGLGVKGGWQMTGLKDAYNGKTLTAAQIRADFPNDQILAWVGIDTSSSTGDTYGFVTSVNNKRVTAILGLEAAAGVETAFVMPFFAW